MKTTFVNRLTSLPKNHPLWRAVRQEQEQLLAGELNGVPDPRAEKAVALSDQVVDMMNADGGEIKLRGSDGELHTVRIPGMNEA